MTKLYTSLYEAIENGINMELLTRATGLPEQLFLQLFHEERFTVHQENEIATVIKEWKKMAQI